jgi:hypothetical protein
VEIQPLAYMLEDLLHEASDDGVQVYLAQAPWEGRSDDDVEALQEEYVQRYQRAVAGICEQRGEPLFAGERNQPGYPDWLRVDHASCWSDRTGVIYVGLATGDDALTLVAGARPHPVEREAITLLPPAH